MNTNNYHPMVLPVGAPRKVIVANGIVCRFGFKDLGHGFFQCVERFFVRMPKKEDLQRIVEQYNAENGIEDTFNPADYGFKE